MTNEQVQAILKRVLSWPPRQQQELAEIVLDIEADLQGGAYHADAAELQVLDAADHGGLASDEEVAAAFGAFRA